MKLQGRNLSIGTYGDDVALLHKALTQLGFQIPDDELQKALFGNATHEVVLELQLNHKLEPNGVVDEKTAAIIAKKVEAQQPERFIVRGQVQDVDGKPVVGVLVRAFDKDLRSVEFLGKTKTDGQGRYEISYTAQQFSRHEKKTADLHVYVHSADEQELATSPIIFNAQNVETVNLLVGGGTLRVPSEYEQLLDALTPVLQGLSPGDLTEDDEHQDVTFLTGETGQNGEHIVFLILAYRLMRKTDLEAPVFYGLFREGLSTDLSTLLAQDPAVQRRALEAAVAHNIIPAHFGEEIDRILARLKQLIVQQSLEQPPQQGKTSFGDLLATTLTEPKLRSTFMTQYIHHIGPIEDFWKGLQEDPQFKDHVDNLQLTLKLGALTNNHLPLVQELQHLHTNQEISSFRDLARFDAQGWHEFLTAKKIGAPPDTPGKDDAEKVQNYALVLAHMIEDAYPTTYIAKRLENEHIEGKADLLTFFKNNEQFDLTSLRLEAYLSEHPTALDGITDKEALKARISGIQRVYHVAPRYSQMRVLLNDGIDSSLRITRMSQAAFLAKYSVSLGGAGSSHACV